MASLVQANGEKRCLYAETGSGTPNPDRRPTSFPLMLAVEQPSMSMEYVSPTTSKDYIRLETCAARIPLIYECTA